MNILYGIIFATIAMMMFEVYAPIAIGIIAFFAGASYYDWHKRKFNS